MCKPRDFAPAVLTVVLLAYAYGCSDRPPDPLDENRPEEQPACTPVDTSDRCTVGLPPLVISTWWEWDDQQGRWVCQPFDPVNEPDACEGETSPFGDLPDLTDPVVPPSTARRPAELARVRRPLRAPVRHEGAPHPRRGRRSKRQLVDHRLCRPLRILLGRVADARLQRVTAHVHEPLACVLHDPEPEPRHHIALKALPPDPPHRTTVRTGARGGQR